MTFVETKEVKKWKPYALRFWERDVGALWLPSEREKLDEFSKIKPNETVAITGYVKWITDRVFALLPTLISNQDYRFCLDLTERRPRENEYIMVYGKFKWAQLTKTSSDSTVFRGVQIIHVYDWEDARPEFVFPKLNFDYGDFRKDLTYRIEGLEPKIADFLAFTAISTPSFYENIGGIDLTLYDSTAKGLPRLIMKEMRRVVPPDIGKLHTVATPFGKFGLLYKYANVTGNADKPLTKKMEIFLSNRTRTFIKEYDELSLSLYSSQQGPKTIEDPPCSLSDIPTVVPEIAAIDNRRSAYPEFDSFKYVIMQHMKAPVIEKYDQAIINIVNHLERVREQYGLEPTHLTQYGFLNANYNARPYLCLKEMSSLCTGQ